MDAQTLSEAMGGTLSLDRYRQLLPAFETAMREAGINTALRAAHWCAQLGHESVGLKYQAEIWGPSAAQRTYDGRMGNRPGTDDWSRFRGHGWIQITGRDNHTACSRWAHARGLVPDADYFVRHPERLGHDQYVGIGPAWYWAVARPQLNVLCDRDDLDGVTRAINGGINGIADRRARLNRCKRLGARLLPKGGGGTVSTIEKRLDYPRDEVHQDTGWNCGPAAAQTIIRAAGGLLLSEATLAREMGTHQGGTDHIGLVAPVLNRHLPGGKYKTRLMQNDPPSAAQRDQLWEDVKHSVDAGFGVEANIVAPPNNYPRASYTSTQNLRYGGGTVYHYVALMGYAVDAAGGRHIWWADSGFAPYGCWVTLEQTASLVPPKGYAYSTAPSKTPEKKEENTMSEAMNKRYPGFVDPEIDGTIPDWVRHADRNSFQALVETRMLRDEVRDLNAKIDRLLGDKPA